MEAGIEHFGRGIETSVNKVLAVVEPSMESIFLARRIKELTTASGANFAGAVLNKVRSKEVSEHLEKQMTMRRIEVLATIPYQQEIQAACLAGERIPSVSEAREIDRAIEVLQASAEQIRLSDQVY
jgi:CO dehydrogenase maturation factor